MQALRSLTRGRHGREWTRGGRRASKGSTAVEDAPSTNTENTDSSTTSSPSNSKGHNVRRLSTFLNTQAESDEYTATALHDELIHRAQPKHDRVEPLLDQDRPDREQ